MWKLLVFLAISYGSTFDINRFHVNRIVNGTDISIEERPYQLAFEYNTHTICGAVILTPQFALSTGNCVQGFTQDEYDNAIQIRAGSTFSSRNGTVHKIKNFIYHPSFYNITFDYDVAILEMADPFEFDETMNSIGIIDAVPGAGSTVTVSGWGYTSVNGGSDIDVLQAVNLPLITYDQCAVIDDYMDITDRMLCADTSNAAPCFRDNGGPVTYQNKLLGVYSVSVNCESRFPAVITNLAYPEIRMWIQSVTGV